MALKDVLQPKTELDDYFSNYKIKVYYKKIDGEYKQCHTVKYKKCFNFLIFKWYWWVYLDNKFKIAYFKFFAYDESDCKKIIKKHVEKIIIEIEKSKIVKPDNEIIKVTRDYILGKTSKNFDIEDLLEEDQGPYDFEVPLKGPDDADFGDILTEYIKRHDDYKRDNDPF